MARQRFPLVAAAGALLLATTLPGLAAPDGAVVAGKRDPRSVGVTLFTRFAGTPTDPVYSQSSAHWSTFLDGVAGIDEGHRFRGSDGTRGKADAALTDGLAAVEAGGTAWVVLVGYGVYADGGADIAFTPGDVTDAATVARDGLRVSDIVRRIEASPAARGVVVVAASLDGRGPGGGPALTGPVPGCGSAPAWSSAKVTVVVGAACGEPLPKSPLVQTGVGDTFSVAFVEAFTHRWADADHDLRVSFRDAIPYVTSVAAEMEQAVHPGMTGPDVTVDIRGYRVPTWDSGQDKGRPRWDLAAPRVDRTALLAALREMERLRTVPDAPESPIRVAGLELVWVKGGTFTMGLGDPTAVAHDAEGLARLADEVPAHEVTVEGFYLSTTEVTVGTYRQVMGKDPPWLRRSTCTEDVCPVASVSYLDAIAFFHALSRSDGLKLCHRVTEGYVGNSSWKDYTVVGPDPKCPGYRAPTEEEWEYAAHAGVATRYPGSDDPSAVAWTQANSAGRAHPVGLLAPNAFGLHDMGGNVWEWTASLVHAYDDPKPASASTLPPELASRRMVRGGSWNTDTLDSRTTDRSSWGMAGSEESLGIRVARAYVVRE